MASVLLVQLDGQSRASVAGRVTHEVPLFICHRRAHVHNQSTMANTNLANAKTAKNDEFYTQYQDIQKEINSYLEYDPNVFRDKTVLLPCDDPEWSNFTRYFAQNFENS